MNTAFHRIPKSLAVLVAAGVLAGVLAGAQAAPAAAAGRITEFYVGGVPQDIALGPDGNLWFTDYLGNQIGRITPSGVVSKFSIPTFFSLPSSITGGPDGNVWFTEVNGNKIGRITPSGDITEFPVPTAIAGLYGGITAGPDGNLWFVEGNVHKVGRITPEGVVTEFGVGSYGSHDITSGSDGNLWITGTSAIGRVTMSGSPTWFPIPVSGATAFAIAGGPDGNIWFPYLGIGGKGWIGKMTTSGVFADAYPIPAAAADALLAITAGTDGNVWYVHANPATIASVTPSGVITEYPVSNGGLQGITAGPDGNIWFTSRWGGFVGRVNLSDTTPPDLSVPDEMNVDATSPAGAIVTYSASATDDVDGPVPVSCAPPSGTLLPIGDATVECTATDSSDNTAHASFDVHVKGAAEQISDLMIVVAATPAGGLNVMLRRALQAVANGQPSRACNELATFARAVYELARPPQPKLTGAQAKAFTDAARRIRNVIAC